MASNYLNPAPMQTNSESVPKQEMGDLQRINGTVQNLLGGIQGANEQLATLISRVYGTGDPTKESTPVPQALGIISSLDRQMGEMDAAVNRLHSLINKLNSLA